MITSRGLNWGSLQRFMWVLGLLIFGFNVAGATEQRLSCPKHFSENMVLQRDMKVPMWGWGQPGAEVSVQFACQNQSVRVNERGEWRLALDPLATSSRPGVMTIASGDETISFTNVLVGEVWVASGQSNMEWPLSRTPKKWEREGHVPYEVDLSDVDMSLIRVMMAKMALSSEPADTIHGVWVSLDRPEGQAASAIASYFAVNLVRELKTPVGIICTAWPGARIEPYIPMEPFKSIRGVQEGVKMLLTRAEMDELFSRPWDITTPDIMYNTLVHPLVGTAMRGVLWYQGESNVGDRLYEEKMRVMIESWRAAWKIGTFPFYYVQLAPHRRYGGETLGRMWEAQLNILRTVPNTGMAVSSDCRQYRNIHPQNKPIIGRRLALWALARTYNRQVIYSGPLYRSCTFEGDKAVISFDYGESGLDHTGESIADVVVKGEGDTAFVEARPAIEGRKLVVPHPEGRKVLAVRMGWSPIPLPTLINKDGLPASPFRTDTDE